MSCGAPLPEKAAFCPACGAKVAGEARTESAGALPAACTSCGSRSLKRLRKGEYVCEHCGSKYFVDEPERGERVEDAEAKLAAIMTEAAAYADKGDYQKELQTLTRGLDVTTEDCSLMLRLGRVYWRLGFSQKALEYYRKAEALDPHDPIVYVNLGSLYLGEGQYAEAKPYYEKGLAIIEAEPMSAALGDIAVAYGNYALCIGMLGDLSGAKKYLSIAKSKSYSKDSIETICKRLRLNPRRI